MKTRGMTLIELMIVVAILGIITAIAWPAYESQKAKQRRSDAIVALTNAAQREERWYTRYGQYTDSISDLGGAATPHDYYTLSVSIPATTGCTTVAAGSSNYYCYKITATPKGVQSGDGCGALSLDHTGKKESGGNSVTACWGR